MRNPNLFYLIYFIFLFTTIYGLTKDEVLRFKEGFFYCKDDICVSTENRIDFGTIIIPNKEGKNITYITDTCSPLDINLGICSSKECNNDSQCLSNKCIENHCSYNEANPITICQYVRTIHDNPIFGDPKGYKMNCGLPKGDKCRFNKDCSSYNCEKYDNKNICGEPDDSGCHSACAIGGAVVISLIFPAIIICFIALYLGCRACRRKSYVKQ